MPNSGTPWTIQSMNEILQVRILEWVAFPFSRGSSQLRGRTQVSHIAGGFFTIWALGKPGVAAKSLQSYPTLRPHRWQPTRLPRPWDSLGKSTGVGWHFLLQCMKMKSESEFAQSCPTLSDPMDCSPPGSSIHGVFQARVLEWGAIAFSRGSSLPRDQIQICIAGRLSTIWATGEACAFHTESSRNALET